MEYKASPSKLAAVNGREIVGLSAVVGVIDSGNDRIWKGAFTKTIQERAGRVKHLWQHDTRYPPIATIVELREVGRTDLPADMKEKYPEAKGGLLVTRRYLETDRGNEVLAGILAEPPAITEMSFGYDPIKYDFETLEDSDEKGGVMIRNLRELRLWDTSDVNWGMNEATVALVKSVMPYKDTGTADEGSEWKKPTLSDFTDQEWDDLSEGERRRIAAHYTWSVNMPPESFGDLKLPHHQPSKTGVGKAVWNGVKAAMGALMGARGGVDIPEGDMPKCHGHLAKHYEQFGKEPPTMKVVALLVAMKGILHVENPDEAVGMTPSAFEKLRELNDLLRAEPPDPAAQAALTLRLGQENILRRLEIAKRQTV